MNAFMNVVQNHYMSFLFYRRSDNVSNFSGNNYLQGSLEFEIRVVVFADFVRQATSVDQFQFDYLFLLECIRVCVLWKSFFGYYARHNSLQLRLAPSLFF